MILAGVVMDTSSFESDFDGWTTGGMDRPFTRDAYGTPSSSTGPSSAADGSYYVYAEAIFNYNLDFDLEKTFPAGQELYGIAFQYHMYGGTMGSAVLESFSPAPAPVGMLCVCVCVVCLSVYLSVRPSVRRSVPPSVCPSFLN